jgi:predicted metal-dependent phosphoesterase TrpH
MLKIDFHTHTNHSSDSVIRSRDLAAKSVKLGIIPAITDHNTIDGHEDFRALRALFIPGEEILTERGDLIGLYMNDEIKKRTAFLETIDMIHSQGGLVYLPHMFDVSRKGMGAPPKEAIKKIDIVEVFNARCLSPSYNEKAEEFASKNKIPGAAGSDSHFLFEFGFTYVELPDLSESDLDDPKALLSALKSKDRRLVKRSAPFFVRGTTKAISIARKIIRGKS